MKHFLLVIIIGAIGCLTACNKVDYKTIIENRAKQDTTLSYKDIQIGMPISKLGIKDTIHRLIDLHDKSERVNFEIVEIQKGITETPNGNLEVFIEQHNKYDKDSNNLGLSGIVDLIGITISGNGPILKSVVKTYMNKFGVFSYYEESVGYFGTYNYQYFKHVPEEIESLGAIMYLASVKQRAIKSDSPFPNRLSFTWEWKNKLITISMYSYGSNPSDVHITYSNNTQHNMENSQEKVISTRKKQTKKFSL